MSNPLAGAGQRIEDIRKGTLNIAVEKDGKLLESCKVSVSQTQHQFLFGAKYFSDTYFGELEKDEAYTKLFTDLFNFATLPFYLGSYEQERGKERKEYLKELVKWCDTHHIKTKGHPLYWHQSVAKWLNEIPQQEYESFFTSRIKRIVGDFKGEIEIWDIVNEIIKTPQFQRGAGIHPGMAEWEMRLGYVKIVKMMMDAALEVNPEAKLILNECCIWDKQFELLLEELKNEGVELAAVGLQSHMMTGPWSLEEMWEMCEAHGRFGWPVHFTEMSVLGGHPVGGVFQWESINNRWFTYEADEIWQAQMLKDYYTLLFSHPAVEAITYWEFVDEGWLNAPSGFLHADATPKMAYDVLKKLIKQDWWTTEEGMTGPDGRFTTKGFFGDYQIEVVHDGKVYHKEVTLDKQNPVDNFVIQLTRESF